MIKTVTFCGHSNLSSAEKEALFPIICTEAEKLIKNGADTFLLGGYGSFDYLCAQAVKKLKGKYPFITSIFVIPYLNRTYNDDLYDLTEYPPLEKVPLRYAISKRNEYMVQKSDAVIAYVKHSFGGASTTLSYAKRKKKEIIRLIYK